MAKYRVLAEDGKNSYINLSKELRRQLTRESGKDDAADASPDHAWFAADMLDGHSTKLQDLAARMRKVRSDRSAYWQGPAATMFDRLFTAYENFVMETSTKIKVFGTVSREINAAHQKGLAESSLAKSQDNWDRHFKNPVYARALDTTTEADRLYNAWQRAGKGGTSNKLQYESAAATATTVLEEATKVYNAAFADERARLEAVFLEVAKRYAELRVQFLALDAGPDLTGVSATTSDSAGTKAPSVDSLLKDLLGGGSGGAGLNGLGAGGSPDLPGGLGGTPSLSDPGGLGSGSGGGLGLGSGGDLGSGPGGAVSGAGGLDGGLGGGLGMPIGAGVLPPGAVRNGTVVTKPDGTKGLDLDGDGRADVGLDGRPADGSTAGGMRLVTGPDGTVGYDITGNDVPDLALDLHPLRGGDLPAGSALITGADGSKAIDINGDGIADVTIDGRAIPGTAAPTGGRLATGPDGSTGFDLTGDGIPDIGFDGSSLGPAAAQSPDPSGIVPGDQVRLSDAASGEPAQQASGGYPMIPPMMGGMGGMGGGGGDSGERERQTWLREDESVWTDDPLTVTALGRPVDADDSEPEDEWAAPVKRSRAAPRTQRTQPPRGYQPGMTRR